MGSSFWLGSQTVQKCCRLQEKWMLTFIPVISHSAFLPGLYNCSSRKQSLLWCFFVSLTEVEGIQSNVWRCRNFHSGSCPPGWGCDRWEISCGHISFSICGTCRTEKVLRVAEYLNVLLSGSVRASLAWDHDKESICENSQSCTIGCVAVWALLVEGKCGFLVGQSFLGFLQPSVKGYSGHVSLKHCIKRPLFRGSWTRDTESWQGWPVLDLWSLLAACFKDFVCNHRRVPCSAESRWPKLTIFAARELFSNRRPKPPRRWEILRKGESCRCFFWGFCLTWIWKTDGMFTEWLLFTFPAEWPTKAWIYTMCSPPTYKLIFLNCGLLHL